jgi:hypothetical protein
MPHSCQQADVLRQNQSRRRETLTPHVTISREELDALLDGENHEGTWMLPEEAVEMGFATSISRRRESSVANQSAEADHQQSYRKAVTGKAAAAFDPEAGRHGFSAS